VGAMDGHADVVQQCAGGDNYLAVPYVHLVVVDYGRLDSTINQKAIQLDGDVHYDLHMNGTVIGHAEPLDGIHVRGLPHRVELIVGIHALDERVQPVVAAVRHVHDDASLEASGYAAAVLLLLPCCLIHCPTSL